MEAEICGNTRHVGTFIILYFTLQLLCSVSKYNCGIKKFEKIMVNKCKYIEYTR